MRPRSTERKNETGTGVRPRSTSESVGREHVGVGELSRPQKAGKGIERVDRIGVGHVVKGIRGRNTPPPPGRFQPRPPQPRRLREGSGLDSRPILHIRRYGGWFHRAGIRRGASRWRRAPQPHRTLQRGHLEPPRRSHRRCEEARSPRGPAAPRVAGGPRE